MQEERLEFFKLDKIDWKVLFWVMDSQPKSLFSWIEYMAKEYKNRKSIDIDVRKLYHETQEKTN
jgi:hypothetical protein